MFVINFEHLFHFGFLFIWVSSEKNFFLRTTSQFFAFSLTFHFALIAGFFVIGIPTSIFANFAFFVIFIVAIFLADRTDSLMILLNAILDTNIANLVLVKASCANVEFKPAVQLS